jgi:hypothetical protein
MYKSKEYIMLKTILIFATKRSLYARNLFEKSFLFSAHEDNHQIGFKFEHTQF